MRTNTTATNNARQGRSTGRSYSKTEYSMNKHEREEEGGKDSKLRIEPLHARSRNVSLIGH